MKSQKLSTAEKLAIVNALHSLHDAVLLGEDQAAAFLDVEPQTLNVWRSTQRYNLPYKKIGRSVRYRLGDLRAWLESRTHAA